MKLQYLLPVVYDYYFTVRTSDEETGPVDGTENEEDIQPQELTNEGL